MMERHNEIMSLCLFRLFELPTQCLALVLRWNILQVSKRNSESGRGHIIGMANPLSICLGSASASIQF